jgi:hypothetical protein
LQRSLPHALSSEERRLYSSMECQPLEGKTMAQAGCLSTCLNPNGITDYRGEGPVSLNRMPPAAGLTGPCRHVAPRHVCTLSCSCQDVTGAVHITDIVSDVLT